MSNRILLPDDINRQLEDLARQVRVLSTLSPPAAAGGTVTLIQKQVTPAGRTFTVSFSSIPQSYSHLKVIARVRSDAPALNAVSMICYINGDRTGSYYQARFYAPSSGTPTSSFQTGTEWNAGDIPAATADANQTADTEIDFPSYTDAFYKGFFSRLRFARDSTGSGTYYEAFAGQLVKTGAITSITLDASLSGGAFVPGCSFWLYGVQ